MDQQRKKYSLSFKLQAIELSNVRGKVNEVAKELGISNSALKSWKKGHHMGSPDSPPKNKSKEEEENIRLRKELYEVKLERDILKKAVSIFSKSDRKGIVL
jgi:transposase